MARGRKARMTKAAKYAAIGSLTDSIALLLDPEVGDEYVTETPAKIAAHLVERAWDVEDFPQARKVTITFNLADLDQPGVEADEPEATPHP